MRLPNIFLRLNFLNWHFWIKGWMIAFGVIYVIEIFTILQNAYINLPVNQSPAYYKPNRSQSEDFLNVCVVYVLYFFYSWKDGEFLDGNFWTHRLWRLVLQIDLCPSIHPSFLLSVRQSVWCFLAFTPKRLYGSSQFLHEFRGQ